ncbi:Craniofacial development protein 2 [Eumeta japonica]|uniref:Craniofacial development protein 2 n=1 Tax=Eumeta variegata TaxID=151549 RepID=A0A4C1YBU3_EUMVA|nr:Craniofacial development protein 2 [Eumeta japonica]
MPEKNNGVGIKTNEKRKLYIATLNCLTLKSQERLTELELALSNIKWDILGLSKVRRLGESIEDHNEYILYYKGETKGSYGVGFMVKKYLERNIEEFKGISERIAVLNIHLPAYKHKWSIIQIYAPTEQHEESTKDRFYDQLSTVLQETNENVMVIGDFNGRIGTQRTGEDNIIGKFGFGRRSKNGDRMIVMTFENNLAFMNSFFKINTKKKWTWQSPDRSRSRISLFYFLPGFKIKSKTTFGIEGRGVPTMGQGGACDSLWPSDLGIERRF